MTVALRPLVKTFLPALLSTLLLFPPAQADSPDGNHCPRLELWFTVGPTFFADTDPIPAASELAGVAMFPETVDRTATFTGEIGYQVAPSLTVSLAFTALRYDLSARTDEVRSPSPLGEFTWDRSLEMSLYVPAVRLRAFWPFGPGDIYGLAGVGYAIARANLKSQIPDYLYYPDWEAGFIYERQSIEFTIGSGYRLPIFGSVSLSAEAAYQDSYLDALIDEQRPPDGTDYWFAVPRHLEVSFDRISVQAAVSVVL